MCTAKFLLISVAIIGMALFAWCTCQNGLKKISKKELFNYLGGK